MRICILIVAMLLTWCDVLSAQSLWQAETLADGTLYSDQVARKKGDLITILVLENTSVTDKNKTKTSRDETVDAAISLVPGSNQLPAAVGSASAGKLPGLKGASKKEFDGEGNFVHQGVVKATITGRVLDVLDNGNLLIEGRRSVKVNKDTKTILITGLIRTADIKADNTVESSKLHNFQVAIEGEGPLTRSQSEGWLANILDIVWPF